MSEPFVVNVADAPAEGYSGAAVVAAFEDPSDPFPDFRINIHVLHPDEASAKYHAERVQEGFLVLGGTCTLILNREERQLRQWDFFHCPAGAEHTFVGVGDGPCWILMVGARGPSAGAHYPVNETAAKYGASAPESTDDSSVAYSDWSNETEPARLPWPPA